MPVNFLIFLVNAFVVPSASIRTRTQDPLGIPAQPPWHGIDTVLAEQCLMVWQPQRDFVHWEVPCVTRGSAGHPGMCHHPQDMEVLPQMPAWLCLATGTLTVWVSMLSMGIDAMPSRPAVIVTLSGRGPRRGKGGVTPASPPGRDAAQAARSAGLGARQPDAARR